MARSTTRGRATRASAIQESPGRTRTSRRTQSIVDEDDEEEPVAPVEQDDFEEADEEQTKKRKAEESDGDVEVGHEDAEDEDDEDEDDEEEDEEEEEEEEDDLTVDVVDSNGQQKTTEEPKDKQVRKIPKKRGRKRIKLILGEDGYMDEDGNTLNVNNDEIVFEDEDPKGLEKVDANGNLSGGRHYRMKTFTLLGKGDQLYMVSTEPARLVGFRDSYLLFKTHKSLFKKVCTHEEKMDLINRHIIPNSYKGRSVNLVTARSIYREFGARIIHDGRKVTDDFWEQRARDNGDVEGEYADPAELYINRLMPGGLQGPGGEGGALGSGTPNGNSVAGATALIKYQTDPSWMYQMVLQTIAYNRKLQDDRSATFRGLTDVYTGLNFFPTITQASNAKMVKLANGNADDDSIVTDTVFYNRDIRRKATGLKNVPADIFAELEDPEIKRAILEQQAFEKGL
ncbi:chromatin structure-remodeling complex subunit RSC7 [[Candida] anglica]|uniref:Chromatin structure-remodeling complex subunit RSC7 n=1 Tax=[Candida] anglica TaxID=148631 RepID=A0ABP0EHC6_9ASCO